MNCNFNIGNNCQQCDNCVSTTAVAVVGTVLQLTLPAMSLCNCKTVCVRIAQPIPATAIETISVALVIGGVVYPIITECCGNLMYADQLSNCCGRIYCFKFASDRLTFIYKGGWRICRTRHLFDCIPIPVVATTDELVKQVAIPKAKPSTSSTAK